MRTKWGKHAAGRQFCRGTIEQLEDRLPLSHAPLLPAVEMPEQVEVFAPTLPGTLGQGIHAGGSATQETAAPVLQYLVRGASGDSGVLDTVQVVGTPVQPPWLTFDPGNGEFPLATDAVFERFSGAASYSMVHVSGESWSGTVDESGQVEMRREGPNVSVSFRRPIGPGADKPPAPPRVAWGIEAPTQPKIEAARPEQVSPNMSPEGVSELATGSGVAMPPTGQLAAMDAHRIAALSEQTKDGESLIDLAQPGDDARGDARQRAGENEQDGEEPSALESVARTILTSTRTFVSEYCDVIADRVLPVALVETVAIDGTALDAALDDILRELDGLGAEWMAWADTVSLRRWAVPAVAVAITGGVLARRVLRKPSAEDVEESSVWIFAQLQDPVDAA